MFDMLLESGPRPPVRRSWGKGVAVALHVVIIAALWRTPASPAAAHKARRVINLPPVETVTSSRETIPTAPNFDVFCDPPVVPPLEIPEGYANPLKAPVIDPGFAIHPWGGPALEPGDGIYQPSLVQEAPELLSAPIPAYPPLLRAAGIQGRVLVATVVDTLGQAASGSVRIVRSDNPGFDAAALTTVQAARFRPARIYGRAVRVLVQVPVVFRLN